MVVLCSDKTGAPQPHHPQARESEKERMRGDREAAAAEGREVVSEAATTSGSSSPSAHDQRHPRLR